MSKFIIVLLTFCIVYQSNKKELINREIIIPENWELIFEGDNQKNLNSLNDPITIIVYINGNCYSCIQDLNSWMEYIEETSFSKKINFIFFTDIFDIDTFVAIVKTITSFKYPIYNDRAQLFWKLNEMSLKDKIKTFLIYEGLIQDFGFSIHSSDQISKIDSKINDMLD